jgi:lipopolysaccharide transport system permease protein
MRKATLFEMLASGYRHRQLIVALTKREVLGRYRGSLIGLAWSFFTPLLMLAVYTFFFSVVFRARWGVDVVSSRADYAVILFVGLIIHGLFAECINRAPSLILSNVNYVKKVLFPLEILPCVGMGSALFHAAISFIALLIVQFIVGDGVKWTMIFLPIILCPLIFITLGITWFLSSAGVYLRDISQTTTLITSLLLFLSPVFYPVSLLPPPFQSLILCNPLTLIIEQSRKVLIYGGLPDWIALLSYTLVSVLFAWLGFFWFQKTRWGFADVL